MSAQRSLLEDAPNGSKWVDLNYDAKKNAEVATGMFVDPAT